MKKLTEKFNAASVEKGMIFEIELIGDTASGSQWEEPKVVSGNAKCIGKVYPRAIGKKGLTGSDTKQSYFFKAEDFGEIEIVAQCKQSSDNSAAKTQSFKIKVW